jgi:nucleotide-binding universal stress UspA family protein
LTAESQSRPEGAPSLPEKVLAIHAALDAARIPHAVGGALALAYYAEPRATIDVDINVFAPTSRWPEIRDALAGIGIDVGADADALARDGQVRLWWDRNPVDLFFSYDPFHEAMRRAARRVPFAAATIPILSPEHLAVCKAMFNRGKDWLDIEQMLVATSPLDLAEVHRWLDRMAGPGDERLAKLGEVEARLGIEQP